MVPHFFNLKLGVGLTLAVEWLLLRTGRTLPTWTVKGIAICLALGLFGLIGGLASFLAMWTRLPWLAVWLGLIVLVSLPLARYAEVDAGPSKRFN